MLPQGHILHGTINFISNTHSIFLHDIELENLKAFLFVLLLFFRMIEFYFNKFKIPICLDLY